MSFCTAIYVKCYLIFPNTPEKSVKMKTVNVVPSADPVFEDQMIPVMSKEALSKAQYLKVSDPDSPGKSRDRRLPILQDCSLIMSQNSPSSLIISIFWFIFHRYPCIVGVKRTLNFSDERTHVLTNELGRMFSHDFQV